MSELELQTVRSAMMLQSLPRLCLISLCLLGACSSSLMEDTAPSSEGITLSGHGFKATTTVIEGGNLGSIVENTSTGQMVLMVLWSEANGEASIAIPSRPNDAGTWYQTRPTHEQLAAFSIEAARRAVGKQPLPWVGCTGACQDFMQSL